MMGLVALIVWIVVIGVICGLLYWLIDACGIPEPFNKGAKVILMIVGVVLIIILLIGLVTALVGPPPGLH